MTFFGNPTSILFGIIAHRYEWLLFYDITVTVGSSSLPNGKATESFTTSTLWEA